MADCEGISPPMNSDNETVGSHENIHTTQLYCSGIAGWYEKLSYNPDPLTYVLAAMKYVQIIYYQIYLKCLIIDNTQRKELL